jgi:23S rRNA pseudouridine1911/1915/1917 synthase
MEDSRTLNGNLELAVPVVYDDEDVVVFNKPVNMPVHPSIKHQGDTLGNCFSAMYPGLTFRPVNRLDKDTSGLCVVAKNAHSANLLQSTVSKVYYAAVCGVLEGGGRINAPIGRVSESIILRQVMADGQEAVTDYDVVTTNGRYTLVKVTPITGRTHQIRVHFSYIGHPLAGDDMYGGDTSDIKEQALHCVK